MLRKGLLVLVLVAFVAGGAFAQSFLLMAKNTVTVDVGPTIAGFAVSPLASTVVSKITDKISDLDITGFGIAAQYERQIIKQLSVAVRGVYGSYDGGLTYKESLATATPTLGITTWAAEGHVRFYPLGDTFFIDGMVGYANLAAKLSGDILVNGTPMSNAKADESSSYIKYGLKTGWRISFAKNGGFTFEPAVGLYLGNALGDPLGERVSESLAKSLNGNKPTGLKDAFTAIQDYVFIGGPRLSLGFGYRF